MTHPEETTRPCRWCKGTGSQTAPHQAPMRWGCPDCRGTGRQKWCPVCEAWREPGHVCEEDDRVSDGANARSQALREKGVDHAETR